MTLTLRRSAALLLAVGACSSSSPPVSDDAPPSRWEAFADELEASADADDLSGVVLVAQDGEPVVQEAFGLADRAAGQPNDVDTRFNLGSVGKMFTAVAVAQLAEAGRLSFDDTVGEHLDGLPADIADHVTIDQLLTHTSGLGDFMRGGYPEEAKAATTATELLPLVTGEGLLFTPGTRESYSNSGYVVLGAIVEAVSGESYYDYVRDNVFEPAGMTRTDWLRPPGQGDNTAKGYTRGAAGGGAPAPAQTLPPPQGGGGPLQTLPPPAGASAGEAGGWIDNTDVVPWGNPSGGVYSTVGDLLRFSEALLGNDLLSAESTRLVLEGKVPMASGSAKVAYGFVDGTIDGVRVVGHGGGAPGVGAAVDIYPDLGTVVVILANQDDVVDPIREKTKEIVTS